ncbi:MAG: Uracil DNA glycosylase superfamily protein [bacterium ADurb.Bin425]|jgi:DNA polymerase|uniref:Type-4 uracil-DNA glycosylase n=1 Tax=Candidatus Obscuribacter phosphatis TaxID=1906157 RepID=A0A8J7TLM3_9BACT|nr:uracil-DNA glycosylase [Candidatus Obscuribacter phosphatis]OPZ84772.1 MAG: Uracil DNA glycosylase superfamily protein [bacterium ADurb.Bin425]
MQNSWESLEQVEEAAKLCHDCKLCETRSNVVFSRGNSKAKLMIIGEGPGQKEDETGLPFVGKAGQLLDKILEAGQISKDEEVYICNVVKCRPPQNRVPTQDEADACRKYLLAQIDFLKPKLILLAGSTAVQHILKVKDPISRIRGKWFNYSSGAKVMPIFHPSYLLRNESREPGSPKWHMWQDIKEVRKTLSSLDA